MNVRFLSYDEPRRSRSAHALCASSWVRAVCRACSHACPQSRIECFLFWLCRSLFTLVSSSPLLVLLLLLPFPPLMARTQHEGVVWVGDLGNRVTDRALRRSSAKWRRAAWCATDSQASPAAAAGSAFPTPPSWPTCCSCATRRTSSSWVSSNAQRLRRSSLLTRSRGVAGGSPRPAVLGRCLSDVAPQCCDDPLSVAQGGRVEGGAPELLTTAALRRRPGDSAAVEKLRAVLAQQQLEREALQRQVCEAEAAEFEAQRRLVLGERDKLQRLEKLCKAVNTTFDSHA